MLSSRALALAILPVFLGCDGASTRRSEVVTAFYESVRNSDLESARGHLTASARTSSAEGDEILESWHGRGALIREEILKENQWAEHGIQYFVRESYADGSTRDVRIDLLREGGTWRIDSRVENP